MKHLFRRTPRSATRPRLLGHRHPYYDSKAADLFVEIATAAAALVRVTSPEEREKQQVRLDREFTVARLYVNDVLLGHIRHYCLVAEGCARGSTDRAAVEAAEREFFDACREALGVDDD